MLYWKQQQGKKDKKDKKYMSNKSVVWELRSREST